MTLLLWLAESAVRFSVLVALAALALYVLRVTRAETQLRVWTLVLLAALALPFAPPQWVVPVDMATVAPITDFRFPIQIARFAIPDSESSIAASRFAIADFPWLVVLYLAIALFLLARLAVGWIWTTRLTQSARPVAGHTFLESEQIEVPVTVGLLRPVVLVPASWRSWPADTLTAVLAHEADHAARRDGFWLTLGLLHRAIHWMNPLSWWLSRRLIVLSERASDDSALVVGVAPARYAEILLGFATRVAATHRRVAWVVPMARHSARDTEHRLLRILTWKGRAPMTRVRLMLLGLVLIAGSVAVYTATISSLSSLSPNEQPLTRFVEQHFEPEGDAMDTKQPVLLRRVSARYTAAALREKIQGIVELEIEVSAMGQVTAAKVTKSLDATHGLDDAAIEAVKQWDFVPRTVGTKRVPSTEVVQVEFRIAPSEPAYTPAYTSEAMGAKTQAAPERRTEPVATMRVNPKYTPDAMRQKIQGQVMVEADVDSTGIVTGARIVTSLDPTFGLDGQAIDAVMQWRFRPATEGGRPVASTVVVQLEFRLH